MLKQPLVIVIGLLAFLAPHPVTQSGAPAEESPLRLKTTIARQRFCRGDEELDALDLELTLRYRNEGDRPLILYKGSKDVSRMRVSRSLEDAAAGRYEVDSSITRMYDKPWGVKASSLDKWFVVLPPGGAYETETRARLFVRREDVNRRVEGSVGAGDHYLQVTIPTWYGTPAQAERLGKRWERTGELWTRAATSLPVRFTVEPARTVTECR